MNKQDKHVHSRLKNWGNAQRRGMVDAGIPPQHAKSASWQKKVQNPGDGIPVGEAWIDEDEASETQQAMTRFAATHTREAFILAKHYRDKWDIDVEAEVREFRRETERRKAMLDSTVTRARDKFWRYL